MAAYTLELDDCPGYVLTGEENAAVLMREDGSSTFQRWLISSVFQPGEGLAGFTISNLETGKALKFDSPGKPLVMGAARPPIEIEVLWTFVAPDSGVFWHLTSYADSSQAVDAVGSDGCKDGAVIQAHGSSTTNKRQLWRIRKAEEITAGRESSANVAQP